MTISHTLFNLVIFFFLCCILKNLTNRTLNDLSQKVEAIITQDLMSLNFYFSVCSSVCVFYFLTKFYM